MASLEFPVCRYSVAFETLRFSFGKDLRILTCEELSLLQRSRQGDSSHLR
jgi:hypothetical protein